MLEQTRKRGASILIYLVFGMLIVIFVINFGAQSAGSRQGCASEKDTTMVTIDGDDYDMNTWRWALNTRNGQNLEERTQHALDSLIRREMLAQEAERRGIHISSDAVDKKIEEGWLQILSEPVHDHNQQVVDGKAIYFEDGQIFSYKALQSWIEQFGLGIGPFRREYARELMAWAMENVLESGAHASKDEAYADWLHRSLTATADVVAFRPDDYAQKMILTDADVDRFLKEHEADVKAKYDTDKASYTGTVAQVKVRRVFVKKQEKAPEPEKPAGTGTGTGSGSGTGTGSGSAAAEAVKLPDDPGKKLLETARADIVAKKKTLAQVAGVLDDDEVIRGKSGDLGWKTADSPDLPTSELIAAAKTLTAGGDPSPVIETTDGFWILQVDDKRSGDLSYDQVKREIATTMATEVWSNEAAKRDAIAALAAAKQSGKALADLYEHAPAQENGTPGNLPPAVQKLFQEYMDPKTTDERKQEIMQIIQQLQGQTGMGPWQSQDFLASSGGDDDAAAAAAPPPVPVPVPPPTAADNLTPSNDTLPKFAKTDKPKVEHIGPFPRDPEEIEGLGKSAVLMKALFEQLGDGKLADQIYAVKSTQATENGLSTAGSIYVVAQLIERSKPDRSDFDKNADALVEGLKEARGEQIVHDWLTARCSELVAKKEIKIGPDVLTTHDDKGAVKQIQYSACGGL